MKLLMETNQRTSNLSTKETIKMILLRIPVFLDLEDMLLEPELTPKLARVHHHKKIGEYVVT